MTSYEDVRGRIERLPASKDVGSRNVEWLSSAEVVGVSRDFDGKVELLLRGGPLEPASSAVKDASEHRRIYREDGTSFEATQIVLPALAHFDQVAAFVCVELLRHGADVNLPSAFAIAEPLIALAIDKFALSSEALLGLAGELLVLEALCRQAAKGRVAEIIAGWHGWRRSARDLTLRGTGIEVKTTTGSTSSHLVEGVHQVERDQEGDEDRFFLVSVGLRRASSSTENVFTVPSLVDRITQRMLDCGIPPAIKERFIFHVAEYGAVLWSGYDHHTQSAEPAYLIPFQTTFFRAYDMDDSAVDVLRLKDVTAFRHVVDGSVRFRLDLSQNGPVSAGNPVEGANQAAKAMLGG